MAMARAQLPETLQDVLVSTRWRRWWPYDMSGAQLPWILGDPFYTQPAYIFYILKGWNEVYGSLFESFADIWEPYAAMLDTMLNGSIQALRSMRCVQKIGPRCCCQGS